MPTGSPVFRADSAFAKPEIYEALEKQGVKYAIRLPANDNLQRNIEELLTRPVGRPSHKPVVWYKGFLYQAASWRITRRFRSKQVRLALSLLAYNLGAICGGDWRCPDESRTGP